MIEVSCPHCGHALRIPDEYAGARGGCSHCGGRFQVPVPAGPPFEQAYGASARPAVERRSGAKSVIIGLVVSVVVVGAVVIGVTMALPRIITAVQGEKARTPKEALVNFASALEQGSVRKALAAAHYTDKELAKVALTIDCEMRAFEKALDDAYGKGGGGQVRMTLNSSFPTLEQINSGDVGIQEDGDRAEAFGPDDWADEGKPLIKKGDYWYVDLAKDVPEGPARDQMLKQLKPLSEALQEAKGKIGKEGYTRERIETEFFGKFMAAAMGAAMESLASVGAEAVVSGAGPSAGHVSRHPIDQAATTHAPPSPAATRSLDPPGFLGLREGMSQEEVFRAIGTPPLQESSPGKYTRWQIGDVTGVAQFEGGKLRHWEFRYIPIGRLPPWKPPVRPARPEHGMAIETGMAYADIVEIVGCEGVPMSSSPRLESYVWFAETPEARPLEVVFSKGPTDFGVEVWAKMQNRRQNWGVTSWQWRTVRPPEVPRPQGLPGAPPQGGFAAPRSPFPRGPGARTPYR